MEIWQIARPITSKANTRCLICALVMLLVFVGGFFGIIRLANEPSPAEPVSVVSNTSASSSISSSDAPVSSEDPDISPQSITSENQPAYQNTSSPWLTLALFTMSIATIISVCISFYLYRWRRLLLANPHMVVPEEFGKWIEDLRAEIERHHHTLNLDFGAIDQRSASTEQKVSNLIETFMTMQAALDERDAEIRRLKRGYDAEVFRRFLGRFIRVDQAIEDFQREGQVKLENLADIKMILEDAFAECGVESFQPPLGVDYREPEGVADNPKQITPENSEDSLKIVDVLESGYRMKTSEGYEIITPAKVTIYGAMS